MDDASRLSPLCLARAASLLVVDAPHDSKSYCAMRITQAACIGVARVCKEGSTIAEE